MVNRGRAPNAAITVGEQSFPIEAWSQSHLEAMQELVVLLDQCYGTTLYSKAMTVMQQRVAEVDDTLSAQMIEEYSGSGWDMGLW